MYREQHLAFLMERLDEVLATGPGFPSEWAASFGLLGIPTQARYRRPDGTILTLDNAWRLREVQQRDAATQYEEPDEDAQD